MKHPKIIVRGSPPSKSNTYKIVQICGHATLAKTPKTKEYERLFYAQCPLRDKNITGFFKLTLDVFNENNRKDIDNALKIVLDCLQSCKAIKNDRQCMEIHVRKLIDKTDPRIELEIEEVEL